MGIPFGTRLFGEIDQVGRLFYVKTKCFHIGFLPLLPLSSHVVCYGSESGWGFRGVDIPVSGKSVAVAWSRVLLGYATIACGILALDQAFKSGREPGHVLPGIIAALGVPALLTLLYFSFGWTRASAERAAELAARLGIDPDAVLARYFAAPGGPIELDVGDMLPIEPAPGPQPVRPPAAAPPRPPAIAIVPAAVQVNCSQCRRGMRVPAALLGKAVKCPLCGGISQTPAQPEPELPVLEAVAVPTARIRATPAAAPPPVLKPFPARSPVPALVETAAAQLRRPYVLWAAGGGALLVVLLVGVASVRYFTGGSAANTPAARNDASWFVLFRSKDPTIWNSDVDRGADQFARRLELAPGDVRYLRIRKGDDYVIIAMTRQRLTELSDDGKYGWEGTNHNDSGARHLGVFYTEWPDKNRGDVCIRVLPWYRGWGFGHRAFQNNEQGYCWNGDVIAPTVFEIAVTSSALGADERQHLLER